MDQMITPYHGKSSIISSQSNVRCFMSKGKEVRKPKKDKVKENAQEKK